MGSRTDRGRASELIAAKYYKENLWPECHAVAASLPGRDLLKTPGAAVEIKARSKFNPVAWLRQSMRNADGDMPLVLMRPIGYGPERVDDWLMFMRNRDFVNLWKEAYGSSGSKRASRRASRQKTSQGPGHHYRIRVGSTPDNSGHAVLEGAVSSILYAMGFEPGDYEMAIHRLPSGASKAGV